MGQSRQNIIKSVDQLTPQDWAAWTHMRRDNPALISPYFHPDYVKKLSSLSAELPAPVQIICAYQDDQNIGFLAIQGRKFARPAGAPLSDFHGIIQAKNSQLSFSDILQNTGLSAYHFSAAIDVENSTEKDPTTEESGKTQIMGRETSAALNIETTAQDWRDGLDSSYRRHMKSTRRRTRKSEDEIGPRRFVFKSDDVQVFEQLMTWKFKKFDDTGKYNVLSVDWTMAFIKALWETQTDDGLRCDMHALYFGDQLAAVDLGLSDGPIFHSWIVAYDHEFQNYAPGIQLLEGLIDEAKDLGYSRIDMGAGLDGYKRHYATHGHEVMSGFTTVKGFGGYAAQLYGKAERWGQDKNRHMAGKIRRRYSQIAACDVSRKNQIKALISAVKAHRKK